MSAQKGGALLCVQLVGIVLMAGVHGIRRIPSFAADTRAEHISIWRRADNSVHRRSLLSTAPATWRCLSLRGGVSTRQSNAAAAVRRDGVVKELAIGCESGQMRNEVEATNVLGADVRVPFSAETGIHEMCMRTVEGASDQSSTARGRPAEVVGLLPMHRLTTLRTTPREASHLRGGGDVVGDGVHSGGERGHLQRGHGDEDTPRATRNFLVPSLQCPTLQDGLDRTCKGDKCVVSKGRHLFGMPGPYPVGRRCLCMQGEEGTWIVGRWFSEHSTCNMTEVEILKSQPPIQLVWIAPTLENF
jgi:hypothetical protein